MSGTFETVSQRALEALRAGESIALCTVVQSRGSTPRHEGARLIVWPDGRMFGTIGGGTLEEKVVQDARSALQEGRARMERYVFSTNPDDKDSVGLCGGANDVLIEVLKPRPHLLVLGGGHIGGELAKLAATLEMPVTVIDDRPEFLSAADYAPGTALIQISYERESETLDPIPAHLLTPNTYAILATWGWDGPAMQQLFPTPVPYIGLVASRTKSRVLLERFAEGVLPERIAACWHSPIGLDLGAETPAEIAVSIIGEIMAVHNKRSGGLLQAVKREAKRARESASER